MGRLGVWFRVALVAVLLAGAAACRSKRIDMNKVEGVARTMLDTQFGLSLDDLTCPDKEITPKRGVTFECTAKVAGVEFPIEVILSDSEGTGAIRPRNVAVRSKLEVMLTKGIKDRLQVDAKVVCGDKPILPFQVNEPFTCTATDPAGATHPVTVTVGDAYGDDVSWETK